MDDSWLHEECVLDSPDSESDSEKEQNELEERLYAITHHNVRGEVLSPEIAKHFSVHCADDGDVVITLKNSLEDIKNDAEFKNKSKENVIELINSCESRNANDKDEIIPFTAGGDDDDDVVIISEVQNDKEYQHSYKRLRYSDINLDEACESDVKSEIRFILNCHNINVFEIAPQLLNSKKNKQYKNLIIPSSQNCSDWKTEANLSFISIKPNDMLTKPEIIQRIAIALKQVNPARKRQKLERFARLIYNINLKEFKRKEKIKREQALKNGILSKAETARNSPFEKQKTTNADVQDNFTNKKNVPGQRKQHTGEIRTPRLQGSISLNISPFIPDLPAVDLISEDDKNSFISSKDTSYNKSSKNQHSHIPLKWTKEMIRFYTKPIKKKMEMDINKILGNLKRTTVAADWWLDPRDQAGIYQRSPLSKQSLSRRCSNCNKRGHFIRDCPRASMIPACALCGEYYHTDYSCPNKICRKCGVPITFETFDGECTTCYRSNFNYDTSCIVCGRQTHRSEICPDLWRRYHATTGPGFTIPDKLIENKLKYCANCSRKGHFAHDCPFPSYNGEQSSPFVTNYSDEPLKKGTAEMWFQNDGSNFLESQETDSFLQNLSNSTSTGIIFDNDQRTYVFHISGTFEQCKKVQTEIESYVNIRKRKRQEPYLKKKKRRLRY